MKVIRIVIIGLVCSFLIACERQKMELNEPLRLSPSHLSENIRLADQGDAQAAKKVWHHYEFAEGDMEQADRWKARYEQLRGQKK